MGPPCPPCATQHAALLLLGRLDGRLQNSPWADIWLARARLHGAVALAALAGAPIAVADLQNWICGRTPPPRASEGLDDPVSIAAVFHLAIEAAVDRRDPVARATLNVLRSILDDRSEAAVWGGEDLVYFGPAWRQARYAAEAPYPATSLAAVAARIIGMTANNDRVEQSGTDVVALDGRTLALPPRSRDRAWLVASLVPTMLRQAGLTLRTLPSLVLMPKFAPQTVSELTDVMAASLLRSCQAGLRDLDDLERRGPLALPTGATRRSRAPLLARLELVYPGLRPSAIARLLNITPQGARKMRSALR